MIQANSGPSCPNILKLLDWYEQPDDYVLILERPDPCQDLSDFYDDYCGLTEDWSRSIILQLVNALKHCERQGVLHRDVKPENILISTDTREVKLFDFGCGDFLKDSSYKHFAGW
ncbi:MAG: protein kinase domain-containing protein [Aeromonas sp.]